MEPALYLSPQQSSAAPSHVKLLLDEALWSIDGATVGLGGRPSASIAHGRVGVTRADAYQHC